MEPITISTNVQASLAHVWECFTAPAHITQWCHASEDWHAPAAENDLRVGGRFKTTMAAKDGSFEFDWGGEYTDVEPLRSFRYIMDDGRAASLTFEAQADGVRIVETFDPEQENPVEMQREGWQAILDSFQRYAESIA
jgi:uncharacterized protein YndB with AHSA1/START domain